MSELKMLFIDKIRLLKIFQETTQKFYDELKITTEHEKRIDLIDELSTSRESNFRAILALDERIEAVKMMIPPSEFQRLAEDLDFQDVLQEIVSLSDNIRLTDSAVFLYIQSIGGELRAELLRQIKDKQTVSKFKSQGTPTTGEGLDKTL